jgi:hypothetical protein
MYVSITNIRHPYIRILCGKNAEILILKEVVNIISIVL